MVKIWVNPRENALIRGDPYTCKVIGDGTVKHYGVDLPNQ